jgi:hypothetical protein
MRTEELMPILLDRKLAQLGDAFINLAYSLALTRRLRHPVGTKVSDRVLADAARKAGIRRLLPRRMSRGDVSNAIESLMAYAWLNHQLTIDEASTVLERQAESPSDAFASLSSKILEKLLSA